MRRALVFVTLLAACGPRFSGRPCRPLPAPSAESFEHCGGMIYRSGAGSAAPYGIRLDNRVPKLELVDVCVLLDDQPLFTQREAEGLVATMASGPATWSGKIANVRHQVLVQLTYRPTVRDDEAGATTSDRIFLRGAVEVAPAAGAELVLTATDKGSGKAEARLAIEATLPAGTAQPRCE